MAAVSRTGGDEHPLNRPPLFFFFAAFRCCWAQHLPTWAPLPCAFMVRPLFCPSASCPFCRRPRVFRMGPYYFFLSVSSPAFSYVWAPALPEQTAPLRAPQLCARPSLPRCFLGLGWRRVPVLQAQSSPPPGPAWANFLGGPNPRGPRITTRQAGKSRVAPPPRLTSREYPNIRHCLCASGLRRVVLNTLR